MEIVKQNGFCSDIRAHVTVSNRNDATYANGCLFSFIVWEIKSGIGVAFATCVSYV